MVVGPGILPSTRKMSVSDVSIVLDGNHSTYGIFPLQGNGTGTGAGTKWKVYYHVEMFTLVRNMDRDQGPLFSIVPVPFPEPVMVPFPCSLKKL